MLVEEFEGLRSGHSLMLRIREGLARLYCYVVGGQSLAFPSNHSKPNLL